MPDYTRNTPETIGQRAAGGVKPPLRNFIDRAAIEAGVPRGVILDDVRADRIVFPRQRAMADAHLAGWSLAQVARHFHRDRKRVQRAVKLRREGKI